MDREQAPFPFTPSVRNWLQSFAGEPLEGGWYWLPSDDLRFGVRRAEGADEWDVVRSERGSAARRLMSGPAEYVERYFVWLMAGIAQWVLQRRSEAEPSAPLHVPVPDGSLTLKEVDDEVRVTGDGEVVARFESGFGGERDAVAFTYYGRLPIEFLIDQIMGPTDAMAFPPGARYRSLEEQSALAQQIQNSTREALERWQRPVRERRELELRALQRSASLPVIRLVREQVRYFSFVAPRPKEAEGDSLQVAWKALDATDVKQPLAALLLARGPRDERQRIRYGNESLEVTVETGTAWLTAAGDPRTEPLVLLRVWHAEHVYDVTPELIERVVRLERRFDELGLADRPRQTDLHGFVTPERYPELYDEV